MPENSIITVGICPCWDITCCVDGAQWGEHKKITSQTIVPAGKALNISRALAWLKTESVAAGLWGESDHERMIDELSGLEDFIDARFTVVRGRTRQNITVVDTKSRREMHLRAKCKLTSEDSIKQLGDELEEIATSTSTVIFSGSLPEQYLDECLEIIKGVRDKGAKMVIDTSGPALQSIVEIGGIYLVKPNVEELCQLLGREVNDDVSSIVRSVHSLGDKVDIVVVSRADKGAVAVTKEDAFQCSAKETKYNAVNTVSCGDYLLAGIIAQLNNVNLRHALITAVKVASAKAWGLTEKMDWIQADKEIEVEVIPL
jgi:1-phosphofructokinase family hexose kinase